MIELRNWAAKRAGGRITITHEAGKVTCVDRIEPGRDADAIQPGTGLVCPVAIDKDGKRYRLA